MTRRLLAGYLTITVIVLVLLMVPLGVFYAQRERERLAADVEHDANVIATLYEDDLETGTALDPTPADTYEDRTGARVVVVDSAGISQVDTGAEVNRDFSTRPEFESALEGVRTSGTRRSDTLGTDLLYVAVPVASGGTVHGALRITLDTADVDQRIRNFWLALGAIAAIVLAAVVLIGWVIARSVTRPLRELTASAERFASGDLSVGDHVAHGPPEIRALDTTMTTMAQRLDAVLTDQRRFVADASHQLRTPLTALRLRLENLQSDLEAGGGDPDGRAVDALERAIGETERLTELVSSLLQLARADARPVTEVVDLVALVGDRVDTWTAIADERGIELRHTPPGAPTPVRCVAGAIEQILDNLLDNALAVSTGGQRIDVEIDTGGESSRDGFVQLRVVDHGPGLDDAAKADAMRRFWRGDPTRPGTGLGLAIVEMLATSSGGRAVLADTVGGGLTVIVEFPRGE
ncbi:MAG TPA: ATP-binding protein [Ilumatobacteraceae bacterium]|nr:ATP-binding protein [Ilumatobacteraceae bacterium]